MPLLDYLAHPNYSSSDLRAFRTGVAGMVTWNRQHRTEATEALRIGGAVDCLLFTPNEFDKHYVVKPEGMEFRSKENKDLRDGWLASGLAIITQAEWEQISQVTDAFFAKKAAHDSLKRAVGIQKSIFWTCKHSGLPSKCRPDWFDEKAVVDLKISIAATRDKQGLVQMCQRNGWFNQLANNRAGIRAAGFRDCKVGRLVVIAPSPPQGLRTWLIEVKEDDMDFLELHNEATRKEMWPHHRDNHWPGTPEDWTVVELPMSASWSDPDTTGAQHEDKDDDFAPF